MDHDTCDSVFRQALFIDIVCVSPRLVHHYPSLEMSVLCVSVHIKVILCITVKQCLLLSVCIKLYLGPDLKVR